MFKISRRALVARSVQPLQRRPHERGRQVRLLEEDARGTIAAERELAEDGLVEALRVDDEERHRAGVAQLALKAEAGHGHVH